jgi:glutamate--cysteine ligase
VELRSLDVNLFEPVGVGLEQLRLLETLMLHCLLSDSPRIAPRERRAIDDNQVRTAHRGREPGLKLDRLGEPVSLRDWALEVLEAMAPAAELLDGGSGGPRSVSLARQRAKAIDPDLTPSARLLAEMRASGLGFSDYSYRASVAQGATLRARPLSPGRQALFDDLAARSIRERDAIEASDDCDFETFLGRYFAQGRAVG